MGMGSVSWCSSLGNENAECNLLKDCALLVWPAEAILWKNSLEIQQKDYSKQSICM